MKTNIIPKIILASGSPRRVELLARLGLAFETLPAAVDETIDEKPESEPKAVAFAGEMAFLKAEAIAFIKRNRTVIGADTVVEIDGKIMGKPESKSRAFEMICRLNGKTHNVITAIAVINNNKNVQETGYKVTNVEFRRVSEKSIREYIKTGEPLDKAGAYAIQGKGSFLVRSFKGCYNNVVGLPLCLLIDLLQKAGIAGKANWPEINSISSNCCEEGRRSNNS